MKSKQNEEQFKTYTVRLLRELADAVESGNTTNLEFARDFEGDSDTQVFVTDTIRIVRELDKVPRVKESMIKFINHDTTKLVSVCEVDRNGIIENSLVIPHDDIFLIIKKILEERTARKRTIDDLIEELDIDQH